MCDTHFVGVNNTDKGSFDKFNIFMEPTSANTNDFQSYKSIYVFCPRHHKENIRMESRIKTASKQLNASISGIVCLGIGQHQDPYYIKDRLVERFKKGQLNKVSSVFLIRSGTHMQAPKRSTLDLISIVSNAHAAYHLPGNVKIQPLGVYGKLMQDNYVDDTVSAYRHMTVEAKVRHPNARFFMPDIRALKKEKLQ